MAKKDKDTGGRGCTMNELTRTELPAERDLSETLFVQFVQYIDRGEKTTRVYLGNLRQFAAWLRYNEIRRPVRADIAAFRSWLASEHDAITLTPDGWTYRKNAFGEQIRISCSAATVAQYLRAVCQFFRWTASAGLYPDVAANLHAPKVRTDQHRKDFLTPAEVAEIEASIKAGPGTEEQRQRLLAIYLLAVTAGLRTVEISRANVKDLETKGGLTWIYIWGKGRSGPDQRKALAPEVADEIRAYLGKRRTGPLFVATGNRSGGQRLASTTISTMLKRAMQSAGYDSPRLTAHSLRHTAGTAVQDITGDLYATQRYMRHASPATTEIYLHNETELREAGIAARLYEHFHGADQEPLEAIIAKLTPEKRHELAGIAAGMA